MNALSLRPTALLELCRRSWLRWVSYTVTLLLLASMGWLVYDVFSQGLLHISWDFIWQNPEKSGRSGGIFPILMSTAYIVSLALVIVTPPALATAMFLYYGCSQGSRLAMALERILDVLAGVPSIVFGLFGNAFFTIALGLGFSVLSGALTLACMILPTVIRTNLIGFESVPKDIHRVALSMGLSRRAIMLRIFIPFSLPSLILGCVLGMARALAETAALLFTSGYMDRLPESVMDSGRVLSVHVYELTMNVPGGNTNAYASALVLIVFLFIINSTAIGIGHWWMKRQAIL